MLETNTLNIEEKNHCKVALMSSYLVGERIQATVTAEVASNPETNGHSLHKLSSSDSQKTRTPPPRLPRSGTRRGPLRQGKYGTQRQCWAGKRPSQLAGGQVNSYFILGRRIVSIRANGVTRSRVRSELWSFGITRLVSTSTRREAEGCFGNADAKFSTRRTRDGRGREYRCGVNVALIMWNCENLS